MEGIIAILSLIGLGAAVIGLFVIGPAKDRLRAMRRSGVLPAFNGGTDKWIRAHPDKWKEISAKERPLFLVCVVAFFGCGGVACALILNMMASGSHSRRAQDSRFTPREEQIIWQEAEKSYQEKGGTRWRP